MAEKVWRDVSGSFWDTTVSSVGSDGNGDMDETISTIAPDSDSTVALRRQLYAILVQLNGPRKFELYRMDKRHTLIGRTRSDRVSIAVDDRAVSSIHCKLSVEQDEDGRVKAIAVEDQESENGTWVNGKLVERAKLNDRDVLRLGETELLFIQI
ncbi:MAG: FHA domain-containing protein [Armatimonadota bacterium]|nr:FHA domain-containing protein [Armatimonadota bacterium]